MNKTDQDLLQNVLSIDDIRGIQFSMVEIRSQYQNEPIEEQRKHIHEKLLSLLPVFLREAILKHEQWIESGKKNGEYAEIIGKNIGFHDFSGFNLHDSRFSECVFSGSLFESANLSEADFSESIFVGADFSNANCHKTEFWESKLCYSDFSSANCIEACFGDANLCNADFYGANCALATFRGANLSNVDFASANIAGANFEKAILDGTNLIGVQSLQNVKFKGADISHALLSLNDITMEQLGECKYTPELAKMIKTKYYLNQVKKSK